MFLLYSRYFFIGLFNVMTIKKLNQEFFPIDSKTAPTGELQP
jgi:hypothetical protein